MEGHNQIWVLESCLSGPIRVELEERDGDQEASVEARPMQGINEVWGQVGQGVDETRVFLKGEIKRLGKRMRKGVSRWLRLGLGWVGVPWWNLRDQDVRKEKLLEASGK